MPRSLIAALLAALTTWYSSPSVSADPDPNEGLVPVTRFDGPALDFDFPGMQIGVAEYAEGPTGATVFFFPAGVNAAVDVRGGSPGTILTETLQLGYDDAWIKAIALAGGSVYGLSAATGAALEIRTRTADPGRWSEVPGVPGAVVFDLGERRYNAVVPDERLGRAALRHARPNHFPLGARGAGRFVMQGHYFGHPRFSGQGAAFGQYGETRIAVFTVVNAMGAVVDRSGRVAVCDAAERESCPWISDLLANTREAMRAMPENAGGVTRATTISLVVTNRKLPFAQLQRLATQVHTSMGRAIQPFHTLYDGDTLFAVTTGEVEDDRMSVDQLGVLAGELAWDAVLASIPARPERPKRSDRPVNAETLERLSGVYEFAPGARAEVVPDGERLIIHAPARGTYYLPSGARVTLMPTATGDFLLATPRQDLLRFENGEQGRVNRLVINPDGWPVSAVRVD